MQIIDQMSLQHAVGWLAVVPLLPLRWLLLLVLAQEKECLSSTLWASSLASKVAARSSLQIISCSCFSSWYERENTWKIDVAGKAMMRIPLSMLLKATTWPGILWWYHVTVANCRHGYDSPPIGSGNAAKACGAQWALPFVNSFSVKCTRGENRATARRWREAGVQILAYSVVS